MEHAASQPEHRADQWYRLALWCLVLLHSALATDYLVRDLSLPTLAQLDHYERAFELEIRMRGAQTASGVWQAVIGAADYRPPLLFILAQPGLRWFGRWHQAAAWCNPLWIAALLLATAHLTRRLGGDAHSGLLAATCLGAAPGLLGQRGYYLPFMPMTACATVYAAALVTDFARPSWRTRLLAAVAAGAGLLLRWDFAIYAVAIGFGAIAHQPAARRYAVCCQLAHTTAVALLLAGWWYVASFGRTSSFYIGEGVLGSAHRNEGYIERWSYDNLVYYPWRLGSMLLGWHALCAMGVALAWLAWQRQRSTLLLACWLILPWPFYLVVPMKSARYVLPVLPALAVALALMLRLGLTVRWHRPLALWLTCGLLAQTWALCFLPGAEHVWPPVASTAATRGYVFEHWEDALDTGQLRPERDPSWRQAIDRIVVELADHRRYGRGDPRLLYCEIPEVAYLSPLRCDPRLGLGFSALVLMHLPPGQRESVLAVFSHIVIAGPPRVTADPADAAMLATLYQLLEHEIARRGSPQLIRLPDQSLARLYGPR
jgi:hypothetical protein